MRSREILWCPSQNVTFFSAKMGTGPGKHVIMWRKLAGFSWSLIKNG